MQLEIAHRQNLLLYLPKNREATSPDIQIRIQERSNRPPFYGSAIYIIT